MLALIATDAKPGEAHVSESSSTEGTSEAEVAVEAAGEAGELQGDTAAQAESGSAQEGAARRPAGPRRYSPVVMRMAAEHQLDLEKIEGTGRGGRVRKQDVLAYLADGGAPEEPPMHIESPYKPDEPAPPKKRAPRFERPAEVATTPAGTLSRMRQSIGRAMVESLQTAATCTTIAEADMTRVDAARRRLGVSFLPVIARATVETLREYPMLNATLEGEAYTRYDDRVHLGIAVALGDEGLIVPVIRDAQELSVEGLAARIKELAQRARSGELTADEVRGGTFTITNPGRCRLDPGHAGDQPAAGGDPRHRGRRQAARGRHGRARQRLDRDPPDDLPVHELGSPGARRHHRRALPARAGRPAGGLAGLIRALRDRPGPA